jgi:AraC family transcriptional regulator
MEKYAVRKKAVRISEPTPSRCRQAKNSGGGCSSFSLKLAKDPSENSMDDVIPLLMEVQSNLDRDIRLESLARQYGYSPFHFHRFFSKTVGETPKRHVDRLRLERAAYKLAITGESVLAIALSVGFKNHETFSRAFRRAFGHTPTSYRRACRSAQAKWSKRNRGFRGEGCLLSDVRFVTLPAMALLAIRHHGPYADLPVPFTEGDELWNELVGWARHKQIPCRALAFLICYDDPTLTPGPLQRCDACIQAGGDVVAAGRVRRLDFAGGRYAAIEHAGPLCTIDQAYYNCADGIRQSRRYEFEVGPPVQLYQSIHVGGDAASNLTEVYFPVRKADH